MHRLKKDQQSNFLQQFPTSYSSSHVMPALALALLHLVDTHTHTSSEDVERALVGLLPMMMDGAYAWNQSGEAKMCIS